MRTTPSRNAQAATVAVRKPRNSPEMAPTTDHNTIMPTYRRSKNVDQTFLLSSGMTSDPI
jgi:hypothetical protein